jgi:hypothetical protein
MFVVGSSGSLSCVPRGGTLGSAGLGGGSGRECRERFGACPVGGTLRGG